MFVSRIVKSVRRTAGSAVERVVRLDSDRRLLLAGNVVVVTLAWLAFVLRSAGRPGWALAGALIAGAYTIVAAGSALLLLRAAQPDRRRTADADRPRADGDRWRGAECLTAQERRVVELACAGLSNRRIGDELFISVATVKSHVYRKLGLRSRWELIRRFGVPTAAVSSAPRVAGRIEAAFGTEGLAGRNEPNVGRRSLLRRRAVDEDELVGVEAAKSA